jgi:hypothetical protein
MSDAEYVKSCQSDCEMAAMDVKGVADYAAYAFKQGNNEDARKYTAMVTERAATLASQFRSLEYALAKLNKP